MPEADFSYASSPLIQLCEEERDMPSIALTPEIEQLALAGAWFVFSSSGGKDSGCAISVANAWLDSIGHPRGRRLILHADLGRAEWPDTIDTVRAVARHFDLPLETVKAPKDLVWRFQDRWRRSLERYANLETIALTPPWSSSNSLFCRSEQKSVQLSKRKARLAGDLPVVGVVGIRRQESPGRSKAPIASADNDMIRRNNRAGLLWNPIIEWTVDDVFAHHNEKGIPLHRAYALGSSRLSCALCVLCSRSDAFISVQSGGNKSLFRDYAALELRSAFPFQPKRWLADLVADAHIDQQALAGAKRIAEERVKIQKGIPEAVVKRKSIVNISAPEAKALASVRADIADLYGIAVKGRTEADILRLSKYETVS